ncbi:tumor necrosis factor receptor superfamily member 1A [Archocentrus centrarchus]|uniref:tumor necrosis factor receptor superfamily member 1A n=1 Tax=Archocentrus centrarchus TaxID=63155 RepID=UPI0011E9CAC6|nr:tumor necrosis factor receptor superfamily member 1A-like [Archocentrus centrarchus]
MDLILVFPLILALISCGQSHTNGTGETSDSCYKLCRAGYHKVGTCDDPVQKYKCKKCENGTFTEIENYKEKCFRCDSCNLDEIVQQPCSYKSNIVCDCKAGYYNSGSDYLRHCKKCSCKNCRKNDDYRRSDKMSVLTHYEYIEYPCSHRSIFFNMLPQIFRPQFLFQVFPLILALISCGQSHTEGTGETNNSCYKLCPAGYHKVGTCDDPVQKNKCKQCEDGTFTEIENSKETCLRCDSCDHDQKEMKSCSFNRNVVCGCKAGYYNSGSAMLLNCIKCTCPDPSKNADHTKMCQDCERPECQNDSEFKKQCETNPPTTASTTTVTNETFISTTVRPASAPTPAPTEAPFSRPSAFTSTSNPHIRPIPTNLGQNPTIFLVVVVATFLLLPWLLLLFAMKILRRKDGSPCWSKSKDAEDPKNEQPSHQGGNPTTQTLTASEGTPMMPLIQNPATSDHPTYISSVMPVSDLIVVRQDVQSDHWPAIVLYAIIKEVPLHRWKEFLRLLKVADQQLERIELEAGFTLGSMEKQYQMLRLWSQRSSAKLSDVFSALHYMDLSGCAQLLQENLEKLQGRPEQRQAFTAF